MTRQLTEWRGVSPSENFFRQRLDKWQIFTVLERRKSLVPDDGVEFRSTSNLDFGEFDHGQEKGSKDTIGLEGIRW